MSVERWYATATLLPDGRVLATAGTAHSTAIGFGGDTGGASYWDKTQPLSISGHFTWADTTVVPGQATDPQPPKSPKDFYTFGKWPVGRDGHAFVADSKGRGVLMGGLLKRVPKDSVLSDAWLLGATISGDDSTSVWYNMPVSGDQSLPAPDTLPVPRHHFAATWAGVEDRAASREIGALDYITCYIHGGLDSTGHVLGDLWRGRRFNGFFSGYKWVWTRLLPDSRATARYGHTMSFDPGPHPINEADSAQYARLVIFGGRVAPDTLADNHLYTFGVGKTVTVQAKDYHAWRDVAPVGKNGGPVPEAREGHAAAVRQTVDGDDNGERQIYFFGGQRANKTVVDADLWYVSRPDTIVADSALIDPTGPTGPLGYKWEKVPVSARSTATPTGRWRPAMAYNLASKRMVIVGGDTNGEGTNGGLVNEILTVPVAENVPQTYGFWSNPVMRAFPAHPGPPPIAGFQMFGLMAVSDDIARNLEVFTPTGTSPPGGGCTNTQAGQWSAASRTTDSLSERPIGLYPNMFVLPDGRLFYAGSTPQSPTVPYKRFYDLSSKVWVDSTSQPHYDALDFGSAVMYRPGKILRAGTRSEGPGVVATGRTETISIGAGAIPGWTLYAGGGVDKPNLRARTDHNLTLLPTGDILASGGLGVPADTSHPEKRPQIWSVATGAWNDPDLATGQPLAPDPYIRNYHSTALLLPDGRVMTAGGERPNTGRATVSIFEPPYLFRATDNLASRPTIKDAPEKMLYGTTFTLRLADGDSNQVSNITSVALLRPGAATHSFDQNQRYVPLGFVAAVSPRRLLVKAPVDSFLATPGEYMLFVVDNLAADAPRVPSLAKWEVVSRGPGPFVDSLDLSAPKGGSYLALSDTLICPNLSANLTLNWTAPADDDTIAFSGPATAYNLRYKLNSSTESNFNAWTAIATGTPGPLGTRESKTIPGLSTTVWYRFQLKAVGDNADTSSLSNATVAKPVYCDDGGGFSARPAGAGSFSIQSGGAPAEGNTTFPGALPGVPSTDALHFEGAPRWVAGARVVTLREGRSRGLSLDRVRLLAVDHVPGTEVAYTTDGRFVAGVRTPPSAVSDPAGRDLLAAATGAASEPVYADSGAVLTVALPAPRDSSERFLLLETSAGGGPAEGVAIETPQASGDWSTVAVTHPRRHWSTLAVPLGTATSARLRLRGAHALRYVGLLDQATSASQPTTIAAPLLSATSGAGTDWTAQARLKDDVNAVVLAGDTLSLTFQDVASASGSERDWFLALDGMPVSASVAAYLARHAQDERFAVSAFRLYQNVPNPFRNTTEMAFDLPVRSDVRLEVFDTQGRRVRGFSARYEPGRYRIEWDLRDGRGHIVPPGMYAYRLRAGTFEARRKMVVMP